VPLLVVIVNN